MKALNIRQPRAHLIVHGHKDVENRSWPTKFRGRVYVHAGKRFDVEALLDSQLCSIAKCRGYHLSASGDGLYNRQSQLVAWESEEAIYHELGLPYQEPSEREYL